MRKFTTMKKLNEQDQLATLDIKEKDDEIKDKETTEKEDVKEKEEERPEEDKEVLDEPVVGQEGSQVIKLFSKIFETREMAHIYHLQAKGGESSHSYHIALEEYYEDVVDELDDLIEMYQAQYGIVDGYETIDTVDTKTKDPVDYFEEAVKFIKDSRKAISEEDTWLQSKLDDIIGLNYQLLYKIKFIK